MVVHRLGCCYSQDRCPHSQWNHFNNTGWEITCDCHISSLLWGIKNRMPNAGHSSSTIPNAPFNSIILGQLATKPYLNILANKAEPLFLRQSTLEKKQAFHFMRFRDAESGIQNMVAPIPWWQNADFCNKLEGPSASAGIPYLSKTNIKNKGKAGTSFATSRDPGSLRAALGALPVSSALP